MKINKLCTLCLTLPLALSASVTVPALGVSKARSIREDANPIPKTDLNISADGVLYGLKVAPSEIYEYDTLQIPSEVTKIAPFAFAYVFDSAQTRIDTVDFSQATNLTEIGDNAFNYCHGLTCDIDLTKCPKLEYIGKNCFFYCFGIKSIQLNENVKNLTIADHAFFQCTKIQSLVIPKGVLDIGNNAFEKCKGLKKIDLSKMQEFPSWLLSSSWIFDQAGASQANDDEPQTFVINYDGISPSQWASILKDRQHLSTSWTITSAHPTNAESFTYTDATKKIITGINPGQTIDALVIPSGVTRIENNAFADYFGYGKVPLILNKELTEIGDNAFSGCLGLYGDLELPYNLTNIGASAFKGCTWLSGNVVIPNGVKELKDSTFYGSGITGVTFHNGVEKLGKNVFTNCTNLSWIDMSAFKGTDIIDWKPQEKLEDQPFKGLSENGAISIDSETKRVEVYEKFHSLGMVDNITDKTDDLEKWMLHVKPDTGDNVYPSDWFTTIDNYKLMGFKKDFATDLILGEYGIIKTPQSTLSIGKEAFEQKLLYPGKWRLILNEGLKTIKESAFQDNTGLYGNLVLPHTIKEIKEKAFYGCTHLQGMLAFSSSMPIIGSEAFGRTALIIIQFPENLTLVSDNAFIINKTNQTLDFSKVSSIDSLKVSPWITFEDDARGIIIAKDKTMAGQLNKYFATLQEKFNVGFDENNWKIVEAV